MTVKSRIIKFSCLSYHQDGDSWKECLVSLVFTTLSWNRKIFGTCLTFLANWCIFQILYSILGNTDSNSNLQIAHFKCVLQFVVDDDTI